MNEEHADWPSPIDSETVFYIRGDGDGGYEFTDDRDRLAKKYISADTATPNDQVVAMMREAFSAGFGAASLAGDRPFIEYQNKFIADIRSRYAASDSD